MNKLASWVGALILTVTSVNIMACSNPTVPKAKKMRSTFLVPAKKYAAPTTYNRLKQVSSPSPILSPNPPAGYVPLMLPIIRLKSDNKSLEEVAAALARSMQYDFYCAYSIANEKLTIEAVGDIEKLSRLIADKSGITVVVDHSNKQIQFLTGEPA